MSDLAKRANEYLSNGGLFNPELMDHDKVRDLIVDCRQEIEALEAREDTAAVYFERIKALEAENARLHEALARARVWHKCEDKALSKSGRADANYYWQRAQHQEQIDEISAALAGKEPT